jgi:hypothetical protein
MGNTGGKFDGILAIYLIYILGNLEKWGSRGVVDIGGK